MACNLCSFVGDKLKNFNQHMRRTHGVRKRIPKGNYFVQDVVG